MELHLRRANKLELGVQIYTELRMFDRARTCLNGQTGETQQHLLREQAKWADTGLGDQRAAAEMYLEAGESMKVQLTPLLRTVHGPNKEISYLFRSKIKNFTYHLKNFLICSKSYWNLIK